MVFAVYLPPQAEQGGKLPVLYWLSGLTCTDENFMQKAAAHRLAAELGIIIVAPDTSPRGADVADDPDGASTSVKARASTSTLPSSLMHGITKCMITWSRSCRR